MSNTINQQPMAADLVPGQQITSTTDRQVKVIAKVAGYAPFMRIEFDDGDWITPTMTTRFEVHNP
ncbi:hypothetical protein ABT336_12025 [Micromonospora sp. NPDC000207]|uniref:hypothetical protein n=1 Tax=Micromonospora sp. NPDC000207 TaxID=3154246 RepID=UPI003328BE6A